MRHRNNFSLIQSVFYIVRSAIVHGVIQLRALYGHSHSSQMKTTLYIHSKQLRFFSFLLNFISSFCDVQINAAMYFILLSILLCVSKIILVVGEM